MTKFIKPFTEKPETFSQKFDKDEISITIDDEKINVYKQIQAANVDTDLRQVMLKYGCTREQGIDFMKKFNTAEGFYGDFTKIQNGTLGTNILDGQDKLMKFWKKLPADLRAALNNNMGIDAKIAEPIIKEYFEKKLKTSEEPNNQTAKTEKEQTK